jgi:mono/diheme cytochrome c family protein
VLAEGESLRGDAGKGQGLYVQYCATCHGQSGKGDGPVGATLNPKPADHTSAEYIGTLTDERLYLVIDKGGMAVGKSPLMAGWGAVLKDQDIRDLVAFIRQLSGT